MSVHRFDDARPIKSMPLYGDLQRIDNELTALGIGAGQPLSADRLYPFDQLHYHGTDAVRAAAGIIGLGRDSRVLEVGSGLGGPARYLAQTVGCHITALELQRDIHDLAASLTRRCGLDGRITHVRGDAHTAPLQDGAFDAVVTWLAIHHIPERPRLLRRLARALRPGGRLYIEDLVVGSPLSPEDAADVRHMLYGVTMTSAEEYVRDVRDAGFEDIDAVDMTSSWAAFCAGRAATFIASHDRNVTVHGADVTERLERFFATVARLFRSGSLGGLRLSASIPATRPIG